MYFLAAGSLGTWLDTTFSGFDMAVFSFFGNMQNDILTAVAKVFTTMGSVPYVVLFAVLGLILCCFRRTRKCGLAIVFAIAIGTLLTNVLIKPMVLRIRPYNTLQNIADYFKWYTGAGLLSESDYCFPSGHTTGAVEIAVVLCMCHASCKKKGVAWIFPVGAFLVGCSRVYLMVHYATDVIAGIIVGVIAGILGYFIGKGLAHLINRSEFGKKHDIARSHREKTGRKFTGANGALLITAAWLLIFLISFMLLLRDSNPNALRCAYDEDYKCYNQAKTSSKYPAIDGEYYCKIHWNELSGQQKE